jgi:hypothetical protein
MYFLRIVLFVLLVHFSALSFAEDNEEKYEAEVSTSNAEEDSQESELDNLNSVSQEGNIENKSILDILFGNSEVDEDKNIPLSLENENIKTEEEAKKGDFFNTAEIRVIDKSIGKLYNLDLKVGKHKQVGEITVRVLSCWSPIEKSVVSESKALIEIYELVYQKPKRVFYGWILSQSPKSAMFENPKYDVTVGSCRNAEVAKPVEVKVEEKSHENKEKKEVDDKKATKNIDERKNKKVTENKKNKV